MYYTQLGNYSESEGFRIKKLYSFLFAMIYKETATNLHDKWNLCNIRPAVQEHLAVIGLIYDICFIT